MKHLKDKRDYYESRPLLYIVVGFIGLLAPVFVHPSANFFKVGLASSIVLFACAHKVIQMRKDYRRRNIPLR